MSSLCANSIDKNESPEEGDISFYRQNICHNYSEYHGNFYFSDLKNIIACEILLSWMPLEGFRKIIKKKISKAKTCFTKGNYKFTWRLFWNRWKFYILTGSHHCFSVLQWEPSLNLYEILSQHQSLCYKDVF